jgi:hypothetical protein
MTITIPILPIRPNMSRDDCIHCPAIAEWKLKTWTFSDVRKDSSHGLTLENTGATMALPETATENEKSIGKASIRAILMADIVGCVKLNEELGLDYND